MFRIDNNSAIPTLPAPEPPGTPGFFTGGNIAAGQLATILDAPWANSVQEEIITVIQAAGMTLNKSSHTQLFEALQTLYTAAGQTGAFLPLTGGQLYQPGAGDPLRIQTDTGFGARIDYEVSGVRRWQVGVSSGGNFSFSDAYLNPPNTAFQVSHSGTGVTVNRGDLLLIRTDQAEAYIIRPDTPGLRRLSFAAAGATWLDWVTVHSVATHISGALTVGNSLSVVGNASLGTTTIAGTGLQVTGGGGTFNGNVYAAGELQSVSHLVVGGNVYNNFFFTAPNASYNGYLNFAAPAAFQYSLQVSGELAVSRGARIDGAGVVGDTVHVGISASGTGYVDCGGWPIGRNQNNQFCINQGTTTRLVVDSAGVLTQSTAGANCFNGKNSPNWDVTSDLRLKADVEPYTRGLAEIRELNPTTYRLTDLARRCRGMACQGLTAEDVQPIFPEAVSLRPYSDDPALPQTTEILALNCGPIFFALINAVKELAAKVEELEAQENGYGPRYAAQHNRRL